MTFDVNQQRGVKCGKCVKDGPTYDRCVDRSAAAKVVYA